MKKLIALFAVVLVTAAAATTADAGRFGIKGGVNVTSLDFQTGITPGALGYQAGITWQMDLPLGFTIQPDILYHVKATKLDQVESQLGFGYVEVPINLQWGLRFADRNIRVFAQASPFVGYAVTQTGDSDSVLGDLSKYEDLLGQAGINKSDIDKWAGVNRVSYGAGLGVGIQLWALQLTAQYNWNFGSLMNLEDASWDDFNESNFGGYTVSLAIMFGGKKK